MHCCTVLVLVASASLLAQVTRARARTSPLEPRALTNYLSKVLSILPLALLGCDPAPAWHPPLPVPCGRMRRTTASWRSPLSCSTSSPPSRSWPPSARSGMSCISCSTPRRAPGTHRQCVNQGFRIILTHPSFLMGPNFFLRPKIFLRPASARSSSTRSFSYTRSASRTATSSQRMSASPPRHPPTSSSLTSAAPSSPSTATTRTCSRAGTARPR